MKICSWARRTTSRPSRDANEHGHDPGTSRRWRRSGLRSSFATMRFANGVFVRQKTAIAALVLGLCIAAPAAAFPVMEVSGVIDATGAYSRADRIVVPKSRSHINQYGLS